MSFLKELKDRDLLAQITHEEECLDHLKQSRRTAYIGFDPTADSLTAGHLLPILTLARWQRSGHRAIALIGDGTALVGDPSGKTDMRKMLTRDQIESNAQKFKKQLSVYLDLDDPKSGLMLHNSKWLDNLRYLEFLRDIGPHFSVNRMLTAESVRMRLEKGLSFLEFNYSLLQSYDFLQLYRSHDCTVQLGGDDQWSNMLGGMEIIRRLENGKAFCITHSLLLKSDGSKMGKTEKGAVWLDPDKTSPYEFYQYWRNVEDSMVVKLLKYMTFLSQAEIAELAQLKNEQINQAKKVLAFEVTKIVHGIDAARQAELTAQQLFAAGGSPAGDSAQEPEFKLAKNAFRQNMNVVDFLVAAGLFASKGEVRRLIEQGGLAIDGQKIDAISSTLPNKADTSVGWQVKKGKKSYYRVHLQ